MITTGQSIVVTDCIRNGSKEDTDIVQPVNLVGKDGLHLYLDSPFNIIAKWTDVLQLATSSLKNEMDQLTVQHSILH